ncbi:MAG: hypothetical protein U9R29_01895 [Thermodesulfobacteriota bacterium]|nr:hypothetical protein [Thermodesulfobacteriota bacterium]
MLQRLFDRAYIPAQRPVLVHARLRGLHQQTGEDYAQLSESLLHCLLSCQPELLLIPSYTIYSFLLGRVFQRELSRSEVGRFSEELRQRGFTRTSDPMYSMLDILDRLPAGLDYAATLGANTLCNYLHQVDALIVNIDMPGFYATPIHSIELEQAVPYRHQRQIVGQVQLGDLPWRGVNYRAYLRSVGADGAAFPPYNQQRRLDYLRERGVVREAEHNGVRLTWAPLVDFSRAISEALQQNRCFLVDDPMAT